MRRLVRGATLLLLLALAAIGHALEEPRFFLAAAAIGALVELGLALRARRSRSSAPDERARFTASQFSCSQQENTVSVSLRAEDAPRGTAPYLLLSRTLPKGATPGADRPYLELSGRKWSVHGGIQDAHLSPRLLQVTLDARGAEALGAPEIQVALAEGFDQRQLERGLRSVLRGVAFISERSLPEEAAQASSRAAS